MCVCERGLIEDGGGGGREGTDSSSSTERLGRRDDQGRSTLQLSVRGTLGQVSSATATTARVKPVNWGERAQSTSSGWSRGLSVALTRVHCALFGTRPASQTPIKAKSAAFFRERWQVVGVSHFAHPLLDPSV